VEPTPDPRPQQLPTGGPPGREDVRAQHPWGGRADDPVSWSAGSAAAPDASTQADHPELRPLHPRVKPRWWVGGTLSLLQVLLPVFILDLVIPHPLPTGRPTLAVLALGVVLVAILPPIRYRRWRYALREEDLWIRFGLLTVTVSVIPYRRLQFVDTRQGPIDRLFGLSELVVHTAALGTSGRLPGLDAAEAERLREVLSHIAPDDAV
jgi:uncharacterized protein